MRSSRGTTAWAELRGLPQASRQQRCSLSSSHRWLWLLSAAMKGSPRHRLHGRLCIPLGWAVLRELRAAGRFVPLAFWPRVLVLESSRPWLESRG